MNSEQSSVEGVALAAQNLRALHRGSGLVVLPNAWDAASASAIENSGFPAVATGSGAVAASLGFVGGRAIPATEAIAAIKRISDAVAVPVTADVERGHGLDPVALVRQLVLAGAAGCNLDDGDDRNPGPVVDCGDQVALIAAVRKASRAIGVDLVINARVDVFRGVADHETVLADAIERGHRYLAAGADCVYPIRLTREDLIESFVRALDAPVNILARDAPPLSRLADLGVRRVTYAGDIFRSAMDAATSMIHAIAREASAAGAVGAYQ